MTRYIEIQLEELGDGEKEGIRTVPSVRKSHKADVEESTQFCVKFQTDRPIIEPFQSVL